MIALLSRAPMVTTAIAVFQPPWACTASLFANAAWSPGKARAPLLGGRGCGTAPSAAHFGSTGISWDIAAVRPLGHNWSDLYICLFYGPC